ncbi:MAG: T9SS type A sorting domain-containing protein, partial [Bacteroidota bacterium]
QSRRTETSYRDGQQYESVTSSLNLSTNQPIPESRTTYTYDQLGRGTGAYSFSWNLSLGNWDSAYQTIYRYDVGVDSTFTTESSRYDVQSGEWLLSNRQIRKFDSQGRILLELYGIEASGLFRTRFSYDDDKDVRFVFSEGQFPGDTAWMPFYEQEVTYQDGLETRIINRSDWDTTRMAFNTSNTRNISYREDGRIEQIVEIFRRYDSFSGETSRNESTTVYEYEFYCNDKLRYEQARPTYVGAPAQFRTTYSYAERPDCAADQAPVSVRAYPNPVTNRDPFLRIESAWLSDPGVRGEIVDLLGRRHMTFTGQQSWGMDISVQGLQPGHYVVHLFKDGEKRSAKFIKEDN